MRGIISTVFAQLGDAISTFNLPTQYGSKLTENIYPEMHMYNIIINLRFGIGITILG